MQTCDLQEILGVFPQIEGMSCNAYALYIGAISLISAYLFWVNVTK